MLYVIYDAGRLFLYAIRKFAAYQSKYTFFILSHHIIRLVVRISLRISLL